MCSSERWMSSPKWRRFPNTMSRMTMRLQRSPSISSVKLIGQPDFWVFFSQSTPYIHLHYESGSNRLQPVAKRKWLWFLCGAPTDPVRLKCHEGCDDDYRQTQP